MLKGGPHVSEQIDVHFLTCRVGVQLAGALVVLNEVKFGALLELDSLVALRERSAR